MEDSRMKKHVTVVSAIQIVLAILGMIGAVAVFFALNYLRDYYSNESIADKGIGLFLIGIPIFLIIFPIIGFIGGIYLLKYKTWARYLVIITSIIGLLSFFIIFVSLFISFAEHGFLILSAAIIFLSLNILLCVYFFWVLFQNETINLFDSN
jgi:hypothetical protein